MMAEPARGGLTVVYVVERHRNDRAGGVREVAA